MSVSKMTMVERLASEYGFDANEAKEKLGLLKRSSGPKRDGPRIPLPFCGECNEEWCQGVRLNHGLYTQCTQVKLNGKEYCKTCQKQSEKNGGKPTYGTIKERMNCANPLEYRDGKGKQVVCYGNVMEKLGISREQAMEEAKRFGWIIAEEQFEVRKKKKGRLVYC